MRAFLQLGLVALSLSPLLAEEEPQAIKNGKIFSEAFFEKQIKQTTAKIMEEYLQKIKIQEETISFLLANLREQQQIKEKEKPGEKKFERIAEELESLKKLILRLEEIQERAFGRIDIKSSDKLEVLGIHEKELQKIKDKIQFLYKINESLFTMVNEEKNYLINSLNQEKNKISNYEVLKELSVSERKREVEFLENKNDAISYSNLVENKIFEEISKIKPPKIKIKKIERNQFKKQEIHPAFAISKIKASSEYDHRYSARNLMDGNLASEWALRGKKGNIELTFANLQKPIQKIYLIPRSSIGDDAILLGTVSINKNRQIKIPPLSTSEILLLETSWPITPKSIEVNIFDGRNNPGFSEIIFE